MHWRRPWGDRCGCLVELLFAAREIVGLVGAFRMMQRLLAQIVR